MTDLVNGADSNYSMVTTGKYIIHFIKWFHGLLGYGNPPRTRSAFTLRQRRTAAHRPGAPWSEHITASTSDQRLSTFVMRYQGREGCAKEETSNSNSCITSKEASRECRSPSSR